MSYLIAIGLTLLSAPLLLPFILRLIVRWVGSYFKQKTRGRRELLLSRVDELHDEPIQTSTGINTDDADWEKVENNVAASATNGSGFDRSWHGIVGFFHPFWYYCHILAVHNIF